LQELFCTFGWKKPDGIGDNIMTRDEELQVLQEFIEKNGVTQLPPDVRGPETLFSVWTKRSTKKRGRKKKAIVTPKKEE
jgi:hypothetical protein